MWTQHDQRVRSVWCWHCVLARLCTANSVCGFVYPLSHTQQQLPPVLRVFRSICSVWCPLLLSVEGLWLLGELLDGRRHPWSYQPGYTWAALGMWCRGRCVRSAASGVAYGVPVCLACAQVDVMASRRSSGVSRSSSVFQSACHAEGVLAWLASTHCCLFHSRGVLVLQRSVQRRLQEWEHIEVQWSAVAGASAFALAQALIGYNRHGLARESTFAVVSPRRCTCCLLQAMAP